MSSDRARQGSRLDVVIVGGGIAGLTAAWRLRHRSMLLLEASDRLGGRMRSEAHGDYWLNYGAHLVPAPGSLLDTISGELELATVPVWGGMMGIAVHDRKLTTGPVASYPLRLPLTVRERAAFARQGLRIRRAVSAYHRLARRWHGEQTVDARTRFLSYEDDRTFSAFLGAMPAAVEKIFSTAAHRATAELDELSAGCGIGLFALVWDGSRSLIARNMLGGTGRLPAELGKRLGERVRVDAKASSIRPDGDDLVIRYETAAGTQVVRTRHVVVAVQAPFAAALVHEIAPTAADALGKFSYGAFLSVAVATKETAPMPWDGLYAMATPGRVFDMFTNQAHVLRTEGPRQPGGSLMLFAGGQSAAAMSEESDEVIVSRFLDDLTGLYPETASIVEDARVHRWALGNVFARPGRHLLQQPLEGALGSASNLHLAGDYFAELGNLEAAARSGAAAAARVDALLAREPPASPESTHPDRR